jgi:hypothetical protein
MTWEESGKSIFSKQFRLKTVFLQMNFYFYRRFRREFAKENYGAATD